MNSRLKIGMATLLLLLTFVAVPVMAAAPEQTQAPSEQQKQDALAHKITPVKDSDKIVNKVDELTKAIAKGDRLREGQSLYINQYLISPNKRYVLYMQTDGNLVFYATNGYAGTGKKWNPKKWTAKWATDTPWSSYDHARMSYGDFEICDPWWCSSISDTWTYGSYLQAQIDGNLVVYTPWKYPVWSLW